MMPSAPAPLSTPPSSVQSGAPSPQQGGEGQMSPDEVKRLASEAIKKIRMLCEQYGIDFNELVGGVGQKPI